MGAYRFELIMKDTETKARRGVATTAHGQYDTPVFMPVGTLGAVKGIAPWEVEQTGAQVVLGNTYHLFLRPGMEVVKQLGGLHRMMCWNRSILTDSGGYQVFSLARLRKIEEEGVAFRSHVDGSLQEISPEKAVWIQETLNSDIMMVLDECPPPEAVRDYAAHSMDRTTRWAKRCLEARKSENALFGITQGGMFADLRTQHAQELATYPFDGLAIGGLSVGESKELMDEMLEASLLGLPEERPRYFMGVGRPGDILRAVAKGVDMFDCVLPTRSGRTGLLFTSQGEISIKQTRFRMDLEPVDPACRCPVCARFTRGYLRHLFVAGEMLGPVLNTIHNLHFYQQLMRDIRMAIEEGRYSTFFKEALARIDRKLPES